MGYDWIDDFLLRKRSVTKDFQPVWNWVRYHIGGKMFAALCLDNNHQPYYINLKVDPQKEKFFGISMKILFQVIIQIRETGFL